METGEQQSWKWNGTDLPVSEAVEVEGEYFVVKYILLPTDLPLGYHRFTLEVSGKSAEALIISAPLKIYSKPSDPENRTWGAFLPLYALRTRQNWGSGDFSGMQSLIEWVSAMSGSIIATLPLLATFLNQPFNPSPYSPISRLIWNEFYIDITNIPELQKSTSARTLLSSTSFSKKLEAMRNSNIVDYRQQMILKRQILEELAGYCFAGNSDRLKHLRRFAEANPVIEDYARFRATCEKQHSPWRAWPQSIRESGPKDGDYDEEIKQYFLYAQWIANQQFDDVSAKAEERRMGLYLDFPLGVHPDGYDVWRERDIFVTDASGGAPPDVVFTRGQDWGFPPMHPEVLRQKGYGYYIDCVRQHLQRARILRIDHVMGLHRLFWIPKGMEASQGVYVHYNSEEFYAILTLESHRHKATIVGEDLGTVPPYIGPAMKRHGLRSMYILQYELLSDFKKCIRKVPSDVVASIDTHDMPPFAAFWEGLDIEERLKLGLLDRKSARLERLNRQGMIKALIFSLKQKGLLNDSSMEAVLRACWSFLSTSPAQVVLVNLEDLWMEKEPQNIPATGKEYLNWQRKARYTLETFSNMHEVVSVLKEINQLRRNNK